MKKVLIIDYHFPPINNINARRFGSMVYYMPKFGWEPFVLTTNSQGALPVLIPEENIIRLGENYDTKKNSLVSEERYQGVPAWLKIPYFFYRNLGMEIVSVDRFLFSWGREVKRNKEIIKKKNPDLIIASCYPPVAIWMGRFVSKLTKKPWVADLQDPLSLWNNSRFPLMKFLDKQIDKFLIKSASGVITIGSYLASKMTELYQKPVEVIYNGFDYQNPNERERKNWPRKDKKKILYYAGRFHRHRMPAVKLLIDWLSQSKREEVFFTLRSLGPLSADEEIIKYAKEKNVSNKINLLPPANQETIFQEEKTASVLILFEDLNKMMPNFEGTLPGKLMEYLPFYAPVVAITRSDSEIGQVLKETSRGYIVSDFKQLNEAMSLIFSGKGPVFDGGKVRKYSREFQCQNLCRFLDKIYNEQRKNCF